MRPTHDKYYVHTQHNNDLKIMKKTRVSGERVKQFKQTLVSAVR